MSDKTSNLWTPITFFHEERSIRFLTTTQWWFEFSYLCWAGTIRRPWPRWAGRWAPILERYRLRIFASVLGLLSSRWPSTCRALSASSAACLKYWGLFSFDCFKTLTPFLRIALSKYLSKYFDLNWPPFFWIWRWKKEKFIKLHCYRLKNTYNKTNLASSNICLSPIDMLR